MRTRSPAPMLLALVVSLIAAMALAATALAAETVLTATLSGAEESDEPLDEDGTGSARITVDPAAGTLCWELTAENIMPVLQSHIHEGAAGVSGGVVVPLDVDGFEGSSEGCIEPMEDAAVLQDIVDDPAGFYVNLHTEDFQAGAIRGQLAAGAPNTALPAPTTDPLVVLGLVLLLASGVAGIRALRPIRTRV